MNEVTPIKIKRKRVWVIVLITCFSVGVLLAIITFFVLHFNKPEKKEETPKNRNGELVLYEELTLEIYDKLPKLDDFVKSGTLPKGATYSIDKIKTKLIYLNDAGKEVSKSEATKVKEVVSELGEYTAYITSPEQSYEVKVKIVDTTPPVLHLKKIYLEEGGLYKIEDFIQSCSDNYSLKCSLSYAEKEMESYYREGMYEIVIVARDNAGNKTQKKMILVISEAKVSDPEPENPEGEDPDDDPSSPPVEDPSTETPVTPPSTPEEPPVIIDPEDPEIVGPTPEPEPENPPEEVTLPEDSVTDEVINETDTYQERLQTQIKYTSKYGTIIKKTTYITYRIYNDGTKEIRESKTRTSYDTSNYSATTAQLVVEARELVAQNLATYNEVVSITNGYRGAVALNALSYDYDLSVAATIRALEIAYGSYSHTRPNGSSFDTVVTELGYDAYLMAENIAYGPATAAGVCQTWKESESHYAAMIHPTFKKIGVGYVYTDRAFWVQIFSDK